MYFYALASDYDGTLAHDGAISITTAEALKRLRDSNRKIILVTGRIISELIEVCPQIGLFDCVVGENGAVLYWPRTRQLVKLADPVPPDFIAELRARNVGPLQTGEVLAATWEPHETAVLAAIRERGLELQVIFNKGAVMILPSGVNKGTGLKHALSRLNLSWHNTFGVGDAENDHAFLALCECAIAVGNALPAVKEHSDFTTRATRGEGVAELIDLALADEKILNHGLTRHQIPIGTDGANNPFSLKPRGQRILISGGSGSGKSTMATAILEQLISREYQCCLLDPEGDFDNFDRAVVLGTARRAPDPEQVIDALKEPLQNAIINLIALPLEERPGFLARLYPMIERMRAQVGRPHWLFVDKTHHLLPSRTMAVSLSPPPADCIFVTVDSDSVDPSIVNSVDVLLATDAIAYRKFAALVGPQIASLDVDLPRGEVAAWSRGNGAEPRLIKPIKSSIVSR